PLEPERGFLPERRVADFELLGRDMRTVGEQLFGRRRARRARAVEPDAYSSRRSIRDADCGRERTEGPTPGQCLRLDGAVLVAATELGLERRQVDFLEGEHGDIAGPVRRHERLGA